MVVDKKAAGFFVRAQAKSVPFFNLKKIARNIVDTDKKVGDFFARAQAKSVPFF